MTKMQQPGMDKGERDESGEREPKAKASDSSGEKRVGLLNGVAMGKADDHGRSGEGKFEGHVGEYNEGRKEGHAYKHTKKDYRQSKY